jgi:dihydrofolate reductase
MGVTFTLLVAATLDGFIARHPGENPADWASPEDQARFRARVARADWGILGRTTHAMSAGLRRRRIVFSAAVPAPVWRAPDQLWLDPAGQTPATLEPLVAPVHPMRDALILGGTRVHDWFLAHRRIDRIDLTVEPLRFGEGVPLLTGADGQEPVATLRRAGFRSVADAVLNPVGTRLVTLVPCDNS